MGLIRFAGMPIEQISILIDKTTKLQIHGVTITTATIERTTQRTNPNIRSKLIPKTTTFHHIIAHGPPMHA